MSPFTLLKLHVCFYGNIHAGIYMQSHTCRLRGIYSSDGSGSASKMLFSLEVLSHILIFEIRLFVGK